MVSPVLLIVVPLSRTVLCDISQYFGLLLWPIVQEETKVIRVVDILFLNWQKSTFCWLCNSVLQKWVHANRTIPYGCFRIDYDLVMSPSRNFPARAEPSWSTSISELKPSWQYILTIFMSKNSKFWTYFSQVFIIRSFFNKKATRKYIWCQSLCKCANLFTERFYSIFGFDVPYFFLSTAKIKLGFAL